MPQGNFQCCFLLQLVESDCQNTAVVLSRRNLLMYYYWPSLDSNRKPRPRCYKKKWSASLLPPYCTGNKTQLHLIGGLPSALAHGWFLTNKIKTTHLDSVFLIALLLWETMFDMALERHLCQLKAGYWKKIKHWNLECLHFSSQLHIPARTAEI